MFPQTAPLCLFLVLTTVFFFFQPSSSATDSFVYGGCSQSHFTPGSPHEYNVNSVLTSLVNSAAFSSFNNFKISVPGSTQSDIVYGLFQCRGDIDTSDCRDCVAHAVSRLGVICPGSSGGAMQLDGCFVKFDSTPFLGVEDKSEVLKKCGPASSGDDVLARRDAVLAYMAAAGNGYFRVGGSGSVQGVGQCVQDLSMSECQDCISEAGGRLKSECGRSAWGDMYLGKCYVRYSERGFHSTNSDDENGDVDKTLAIIIGIIAGVAVMVVFLSFLSRLCQPKDGK